MRAFHTITLIFVGLDEQEQAKYAFLRGIYDSRGKSFKMEQEGSNKQYSFCVPPLGKSHRVAVYEACIDALAHMTLEEPISTACLWVG